MLLWKNIHPCWRSETVYISPAAARVLSKLGLQLEVTIEDEEEEDSFPGPDDSREEVNIGHEDSSPGPDNSSEGVNIGQKKASLLETVITDQQNKLRKHKKKSKKDNRKLIDVECLVCGYKVIQRIRTTAKTKIKNHIMSDHSGLKKRLALEKCFPPHSQSKGFPCRAQECNKDMYKVALYPSSKLRESHVLSKHARLLETKFVLKMTELALDNAAKESEDKQEECEGDFVDSSKLLTSEKNDWKPYTYESIDELLKSDDEVGVQDVMIIEETIID